MNGWRFWSLDGDLKQRTARAATKGDAYGCGACGETFKTMKAATKHALTHTTA